MRAPTFRFCAPGLILAVVAGLSSPVPAEEYGGPRVALTLVPQHGAVCDSAGPFESPCSAYETAGEVGVPYYLYLVLADLDLTERWGGLACGIHYQTAARDGEGLDVFDWTLCDADLDFQSLTWPEPFGSNSMTVALQECPVRTFPGYEAEGGHAVVGAFYVYAYGEDVFQITARDLPKRDLKFADCEARETKVPIEATGAVRFSENGSVPGFNPCTGEGDRPDCPVPPDPPPPPPPPPPPWMPPEASLLLHTAPDSATVSCAGVGIRADEVVTDAPIDPTGTVSWFAYVLVNQKAMEVSGAQFGIEYGPGLRILEWRSCTNIEFDMPEWPAPGTGTTQVWSTLDCQADSLVTVGYFQVAATEPEVLAITSYPKTGLAKVADCNAAEMILDEDALGWVSFGGAMRSGQSGGCNPLVEPCGTRTAVQSTSWGAIKKLYGTSPGN